VSIVGAAYPDRARVHACLMRGTVGSMITLLLLILVILLLAGAIGGRGRWYGRRDI